jgi:hypothetical protein
MADLNRSYSDSGGPCNLMSLRWVSERGPVFKSASSTRCRMGSSSLTLIGGKCSNLLQKLELIEIEV